MTSDDIIRMATEAGFEFYPDGQLRLEGTDYYVIDRVQDGLARFAALVAIHTTEQMIAAGWRQCAVGQRTTQFCGAAEAVRQTEREACEQILEDVGESYRGTKLGGEAAAIVTKCAISIRARGNQ